MGVVGLGIPSESLLASRTSYWAERVDFNERIGYFVAWVASKLSFPFFYPSFNPSVAIIETMYCRCGCCLNVMPGII